MIVEKTLYLHSE